MRGARIPGENQAWSLADDSQSVTTRHAFGRLLILAGLTALAVSGNLVAVPVFYGIDLIFGSIFVLLCAALFSRTSTLVIAIIGGLTTILLWQHQWAAVVLALEGLIVFQLHRRRGCSLRVADTLFWALIGVPLCTVLYRLNLHLELEQAFFIALKQGINGIFNAALAGLILAGIELWRNRSSYLEISVLRNILCHSLMVVTLIAGSVPVVQYARTERFSQERLLMKELEFKAETAAQALGMPQEVSVSAWQRAVEKVVGSGSGNGVAVVGGDNSVLFKQGVVWLDDSRYSMVPTSLDGLKLLRSQEALASFASWKQGRYQLIRGIPDAPGIRIIVQQPAAAIVDTMKVVATHFLALLSGILILSAIFSCGLGRLLTGHIWKFNLALNNSAQGLIITNAGGKVEWINRGAERITGYSLGDLRGRKPGDVLQGPETDVHTVEYISACLANAKPFEVEILNYGPRGQTYWVRLSCEPMLSALGKVTGFLAVQVDVTEQRKLSELERFGQEAIEHIANHSDVETTFSTITKNLETLIPGLRCVLEISISSTLKNDPPDVAYFSQSRGGMAGKCLCRECSMKVVGSDGVEFGQLKVFVDHSMQLTETEGRIIDRATQIIAVVIERWIDEKRLRETASIFQSANEAIYITDSSFHITDANSAFTEMTGYEKDEVLGRSPTLLCVDENDADEFVAIKNAVLQTGKWKGEACVSDNKGRRVFVRQSVSHIPGRSAEQDRYSFFLTDITELKTYQGQLEKMAKYDSLTKLPNRVLLGDRLEQAMRLADRSESSVAVLFIDLDAFKEINDTLGHSAGDQLLKQVAQRISTELRASDTLARFGGDEFVVVLPVVKDEAFCSRVAERIRASLVECYEIAGSKVYISASIGVVLYPQADIRDPEQLFRLADQAMYSAKQQGKNRVVFFDAEHERAERTRHESLDRIEQALKSHEFVLFYQPKVNLFTRQIIGVEALIRWPQADGSLIPPDEFLPLIDQHYLSISVGEWVIGEALEQIQRWRKEGLSLPISVNVDPFHLKQPGFFEHLSDLVKKDPHFRPGDLEIEILETAALEDFETVSNIITRCKSLGVVCSLDDFGTGYSSLAYLKGLPVERLKIDMTFVRNMLSDRNDFAIVEGVLILSKSFGLTVIAEGVETEMHAEALVKLGCEFGQGYGFSRPIPATAIPGWVHNWQSEQISRLPDSLISPP